MASSNVALHQPRMQDHFLFHVPVISFILDDAVRLNKLLAQAVVALAEAQRGITASNIGGWHSSYRLLDSPKPPFDEFRRRMLDVYATVRGHLYGVSTQLPAGTVIQGWANLNREGDSNKSHTHMMGGCHWSGVYYVEVPTGVRGGRLMLENRVIDENTGPRAFWRTPVLRQSEIDIRNEISIDPQPGTLVLFPSSIYHRVEPFAGEGRRISLAFNIIDPSLTWTDRLPPANARTQLGNWLRYNFYGPYLLANRVYRKVNRWMERASP